jgi:hypothetical protein
VDTGGGNSLRGSHHLGAIHPKRERGENNIREEREPKEKGIRKEKDIRKGEDRKSGAFFRAGPSLEKERGAINLNVISGRQSRLAPAHRVMSTHGGFHPSVNIHNRQCESIR